MLLTSSGLCSAQLHEHCLVGVFDGHGGDGTARYAREHLLSVLQESTGFQSYLRYTHPASASTLA
jgi:serine/threonine protein phosphatase PrpC